MLISIFCHFAGRRVKYQIQEVSNFLRNPFLLLFEIKKKIKFIVNLLLKLVSPAYHPGY